MAGPGPTADPTRVLLRRIVAYAIDASLVVGAMAVVFFVTGDIDRVPNCDTIPKGRACFAYGNDAVLVNQRALVWFFLTGILMVVVVVGVPQALTGTSAGKALLGIRVVRPDGSRPGWWRSFLRLIAWGVDGLALLIPVALWTAIFTPGHRRVGDYLAGTYVVRRDAAEKPVPVTRPRWWPGLGFARRRRLTP